MMTRIMFVLGATACLAQAQLAAPTRLTVVNATRSTVDLTWTPADTTATGYLIERRPLGGDYAVALTAKDPKISDVNFDLNETYLYRIRATKDQTISDPSNEVIVGPPPKGFNVIGAVPTGDYIVNRNFYTALQMRPDANTDPAFAYIMSDPNNDNDFSDSTLHFLSWNRAQYRWNAPVQVAVVGDVVGSGWYNRPVSLALDAQTGRWAIAHSTQDGDNLRIDVHFSDDNGLTWKSQKMALPTLYSPYQPSILLNAGIAYIAWNQGGDGDLYATGKLTDGGPPFTSTVVPGVPGELQKDIQLQLAFDSKLNPAMVFITQGGDSSGNSYNRQIGFWRPGASTAIKIADSANLQDDGPDVRLAFSGDTPAVAVAMRRDDLYYSNYDHGVWFAKSTDDGTTWPAMINMPADGPSSTDVPLDLAFGPRGQAAIVATSNGGSGSGACGTPKLLRSDNLTAWTNCGVAPIDGPVLDGARPNVYFATNSKLWVAFQNNTYSATTVAPGLVLWREP